MLVRLAGVEVRKPMHPGARKLRIRLFLQIKLLLLRHPVYLPPTGSRCHTCLVSRSNYHIGSGAIVFVRFGGPEYTAEQMPLAALAAEQTARVFERRSLKESQTQLEIARQRAQFQDDFIATISHELHTPLGFIKGYTTSLLRSDTVWDPATQREFLTIIDEEFDQLVTLIDRVLDSARLQSGSMPMEFQPVRLDSLLRDLIMRIQSRHKDLEIVQDIVPAPPIQADTVRLAQVFGNLLDNAIKYAPGSKITISLRVEAE